MIRRLKKAIENPYNDFEYQKYLEITEKMEQESENKDPVFRLRSKTIFENPETSYRVMSPFELPKGAPWGQH